MVNYDFHKKLSPYEFQDLVRDILQAKEGIFLESFKEGKDEGIDARRKDNDDELIVQVKRYKNDFSALYQSLKRYELPKVKKLEPTRYIIATSVELSELHKKKLLDLFEGFIQNTNDILGNEDLNNLLSIYPNVEMNYPNLWYSSGTVFLNQIDQTVHSGIYEQTRAELEQIEQLSCYYASGNILEEAYKRLKEERFLLISGGAGLGKTSLARMLASYIKIKENYQFIYIQSIEEIDQIYKDNQPQIFFFDDFWGSCFKEYEHDFREEKRMIEIIKKISNSNNKYLILTSREYVLKQGLLSHSDLEQPFLEHCQPLTLSQFDLKLKKNIYFHLLYHSDLIQDYIEKLVYKTDQIITHPNFNPRILKDYLNEEIELLFDDSSWDYASNLISALDEPYEFYNKLFLKQTEASQLILYLLLTCGRAISYLELKKAYDEVVINSVREGILIKKGDFKESIKQLDSLFLKTFHQSNLIIIQFKNHSIADFLYEYSSDYMEKYGDILIHSIIYINQVSAFYKREYERKLELSPFQLQQLKDHIITNFNFLRVSRQEFNDKGALEFEMYSCYDLCAYKFYYLSNFEEYYNFSKTRLENLLDEIEKGKQVPKLEFLTYFTYLLEKYGLIYFSCEMELLLFYRKHCHDYIDYIRFTDLKEIFNTSYIEYMNQNEISFQNDFYQSVERELEFYLSTNDLYEIECLIGNVFQFVSEYHYQLPKQLQKSLEYYESILDEEDFDDDFEELEDAEKPSFSYIEEGLNFLGLNENYQFEEELLEYIKKQNRSDLLNVLKENFPLYLSRFFKEEVQIDILIQFWDYYQFIPTDKIEFEKLWIDYLLQECDEILKQNMIVNVGSLAYFTFKNNQTLFTKEQILKEDILKEDELNLLIHYQFLYSKQKWYCFSHPFLQVFLMILCLSYLEEEEKEECYQLGIGDSLYGRNIDNFELLDIFEVSAKLDSEAFQEYYVKNELSLFFKQIKETNEQTIIESIYQYFDFDIRNDFLRYKERENNSSSYTNPSLKTFFNYLFDNFLEINFESIDLKTYNQLKPFWIYKNDEYKLNLYDLIKNDTFYKILVDMGVVETVMKQYQRIKELMNLLEVKRFTSLEQYKESIIMHHQ